MNNVLTTFCPICNTIKKAEIISDTSFHCLHCDNTITAITPITFYEDKPRVNKTAAAILEAYLKGDEELEAFIRKHYNV